MGKELYDDIGFVWKGNSGALSANDGVFTEICDLQIPRGYAVRIRKLVWSVQVNSDQADQEHIRMLGAFVLDPDDETSVQIPTFTLDHDVMADYEWEYFRVEEDTTPNGISGLITLQKIMDFDESLDWVTVRNARFNAMVTGSATGGSTQMQLRLTVYFTYEKVSSALYEKLLGIK